MLFLHSQHAYFVGDVLSSLLPEGVEAVFLAVISIFNGGVCMLVGLYSQLYASAARRIVSQSHQSVLKLQSILFAYEEPVALNNAINVAGGIE